MWPEKKNSVPSWPVSSVGRALHRYHKGHGFNSRIEPFIEDRGSFLYSYQHYCYHQYTFFSFIYLFLYFFLIECQATCFKNSSYLFTKSGSVWFYNNRVCSDQKSYLVSIETEEEWKFINREIQKRGTSNASAWHIGLEKKGGVWTWLSGEQLNISKWRDSEPGSNDQRAEISKNGGLFDSISTLSENAYICETPGGKIKFQPLSQEFVHA